jgi:AcrR family transcriptional regulator
MLVSQLTKKVEMSLEQTSTMRDSTVSASPAGKRDRLVSSARRVIYEQGVERSSLADVARVAGVPVGNVYYYFKTKDDLVAAAAEAHIVDRADLFETLDALDSPNERLHGLIDALAHVTGSVAEHGCPFGTLAAELDKRNGTVASPLSQQLLVPMVDWAEQQFAELGLSDARRLAVALVAGYEGAALLTHSLRDPDLLADQVERLHQWVDELADAAHQAPGARSQRSPHNP